MRQVLRVLAVRLTRSKRRTKRAESQTSSEEAPPVTFSPGPSDFSGTKAGDDNFAEICTDEVGADQPTTQRRRVMLRFEGGRHTVAHRRHQFTLWKGQTFTTVVRTLQGCCTIARRELASWRGRSKVYSRSEDGYKPSDADSIHPTDQRTSRSLKRPRRSSYSSAASSFSITSSQSSVTDIEEECRKELRRSEFLTYTPRTSALEPKPSELEFAETTGGSHEQLLLVDVLALNDSDDEDNVESSSASRHLPYRSALVDGRPHLLRNEWV